MRSSAGDAGATGGNDLRGSVVPATGPAAVPAIPGMEVATRYHAADRASPVGGDFYDVFRLAANNWALAIGDACGKGPAAAALTSFVRDALRGAAERAFLPSDVLRDVNTTVRDTIETDADDAFCTVAFARVELDVCGAWVTLASGGHPRPVVVRRSGWVDVRGQPGSLIGPFPDPELDDDRVGLGPGDALVFFTDGIPEARERGGRLFGDDALLSTLLECAGGSARVIVDHLADAALAWSGGTISDDIAVLVVRVPDDAGEDPTTRLASAIGAEPHDLPLPGYEVNDLHVALRRARPAPPREARIAFGGRASSAGEARRFVGRVMTSWRMPELMGGDLQLLTSEVVTNAIRHASGPVAVVVAYNGERIRLEVGDASPAMPRPRVARDDDVGGRGLFLVEQLALAWGVTPTETGKRVWFEVPAPAAASSEGPVEVR